MPAFVCTVALCRGPRQNSFAEFRYVRARILCTGLDGTWAARDAAAQVIHSYYGHTSPSRVYAERDHRTPYRQRPSWVKVWTHAWQPKAPVLILSAPVNLLALGSS